MTYFLSTDEHCLASVRMVDVVQNRRLPQHDLPITWLMAMWSVNRREPVLPAGRRRATFASSSLIE